MSISVKLSTSCASQGFRTISGSDTEVGNASIEINSAYPAGSSNVKLDASFVAADLQAIILVPTQDTTVSTNGTNAKQTITDTGATAGTFTLTFGGNTTTNLNWNAAAADVQTALQALASVGSGNVSCTGGPLPGTPIVVEFIGSLAVAPQSTITATSSLTGGTAAVTSTQTGVVPDQTFNLKAGIPFSWGVSPGYFPNPFTSNVSKFNVSCAASSTLNGRILTPLIHMARIVITGAKEVEQALLALDRKVARKVVRQALRAAMKPMLAEEKREAPAESGALRKAIKLGAKKRKVGEIGITTKLIKTEGMEQFYPAFVNYGTIDIDAEAFAQHAFKAKAQEVKNAAMVNLVRGIDREADKAHGS